MRQLPKHTPQEQNLGFSSGLLPCVYHLGSSLTGTKPFHTL